MMYIIIHNYHIKLNKKTAIMKISSIDVNFRLRSLLPRNDAENFVRAKQKYADAEYIVQMRDSINNTSDSRSNQVLRDLGLF